MTRPRKELISVADTPYYHCVSRCVRRAFLCGRSEDFDFEHRRGWIVSRIKQLASIFCIDIAAYAVMSNHYHVVLRVNREDWKALSNEEVIERWRQLFKGPPLIQQYLAGVKLGSEHLEIVDTIVQEWRRRLLDISWYMRCLNEYIARLANQEDNCTGRFWEGRFKSQALLDERALLSCMAYVDLNPIRAGMANTPETSNYTSIQERLGITPELPSLENTDDKSKPDNERTKTLSLAELLPFAGNEHTDNQPQHLPFDLVEYFQLVDWTGRAIREDKRGAIPENIPPILNRLNLSPEDWINTCCHIERHYKRVIGPVAKLSELCEKLGQRWMHGISHCRRLYPNRS